MFQLDPSIVESETSSLFKARRIVPALGAEIGNVDLREPLSAEQATHLRQLLTLHKVLVFRNQPITTQQQLAFASAFGEIETAYVDEPGEVPGLQDRDYGPDRKGKDNLYHSDRSYMSNPPVATILHCRQCPEIGGDTIWSNMVLAYQELPSEIKDTIEGLNAVHDMWPSFGYRIKPDNRLRERAKNPPIEHPIVLIHPLSQEKILYVNPGFVTHICNFRNKYPRSLCTEYKIGASRLLLYLFEQSQMPEYQMRLHWEVNTIVVWDNLATQHYAISDYFPALRQMRRLTIRGQDLSV